MCTQFVHTKQNNSCWKSTGMLFPAVSWFCWILKRKVERCSTFFTVRLRYWATQQRAKFPSITWLLRWVFLCCLTTDKYAWKDTFVFALLVTNCQELTGVQCRFPARRKTSAETIPIELCWNRSMWWSSRNFILPEFCQFVPLLRFRWYLDSYSCCRDRPGWRFSTGLSSSSCANFNPALCLKWYPLKLLKKTQPRALIKTNKQKKNHEYTNSTVFFFSILYCTCSWHKQQKCCTRELTPWTAAVSRGKTIIILSFAFSRRITFCFCDDSKNKIFVCGLVNHPPQHVHCLVSVLNRPIFLRHVSVRKIDRWLSVKMRTCW